MRDVPPFRYMAWAKEQALDAASYHLALSQLPPPPQEVLSLESLGTDLEQRGRHMPPTLRARMCDRLGISTDRLALTLGTSHAMYLLCATHLSPGDLCLVEAPAYEMLRTLPTLFGARVERFERTFTQGWRPPEDLANTIAARRPKMVLLSNPHNPSGAILAREELAPLANAAAEVGALLVSDEVYLEYLPDPTTVSAFGLSPHAASASSFTKAYGLGTARLGWLAAAPQVVSRALAYNDYISVLYPNPSAWVGLAALDALSALKQRAIDVSTHNRAIVARWVEGRDDARWVVPDAGVVGFVELTGIADTFDFVAHLRKHHDTLVVPGRFFEAPSFVRIGFGTDPDVLEEGLSRLGRALDTWARSH